jgi:lipoprotein-anchoring transpeptidase ErfK/SrfK
MGLSSRKGLLGALMAAILLALLATPAAAQEAAPEAGAEAPEPAADVSDPGASKQAAPEPQPPDQRPAKLSLRLKGLNGGKLKVGNKIKLAGTLRPFAPGEKVTIKLLRRGKTIKRKTVFAKQKKGSDFGRFRLAKRLVKPGRYAIGVSKPPTQRLKGTASRTRSFKLRFPDLDPGNRSGTVQLFNKLLKRLGYVNDGGKRYNGATERAVLAFHKVNGKARRTNATTKDFKKLANGKGGYKLRYPGSGKHVEADLSRQVMVLANGGKVHRIYHVSTGAPATPTLVGSWRFYRKEPGFNSLGMYYSVYYHRGYAIHGYKSVPTWPASHGCLRNPIPDSRYIYNWVDIGDRIHIYR